MGKHIQKTSVLVCTLSTRRESPTVLHMPLDQLCITQPLIRYLTRAVLA
jgi:hypothetical protein